MRNISLLQGFENWIPETHCVNWHVQLFAPTLWCYIICHFMQLLKCAQNLMQFMAALDA